MRSGRAPFSDDMHSSREDELAAAPGGYLTYSGSDTVVSDGLIAHHIAISLLPNWIGGTQYRAPAYTGHYWSSARRSRSSSMANAATPSSFGDAPDQRR
jgi:hypothetical protein